jgi:hypothetical protein
MVNLNRQIAISRARQGGFSSHVLSEPVPYAVVPSVPSLIIYYTATEVATTAESATISYSDRFSGSYGVTEFMGANALSPSGSGFTGGEFIVNVTDVPIGIQDFTFEGWTTTGNTDNNNTQAWLYFPNLIDSTIFYAAVSLLIRDVVDGYRRDVSWRLNDPFFMASNAGLPTFNSSTPIPPTHISVQRISGIIYIHFNGEIIAYENGGPVEVDLGSSFSIYGRVDATAGTASLGQIRMTSGVGIYGTGSFTPPTGPFFTP